MKNQNEKIKKKEIEKNELVHTANGSLKTKEGETKSNVIKKMQTK